MDSRPYKDSPTTKITLNTDTERFLYKRYIEARDHSEKLESLVNDLNSQIEILKQQLKCLAESTTSTKKPTKPTTMDTSAPPAQYSTDEEELARETEWIRAKTRKKRKLNFSPVQDKSIDDESSQNKEKSKKNPQPPPIIVDGIQNYQKFYDYLLESQKVDTFTVKMMNGETVKINAVDGETYRSLTETLSKNNCLWHSYENKQERPIRVMAKKLHASCKPTRIVEELKAKGFNIIEAVNKLSWKTKEPLNMFMLTFDNKEDTNKIYNIKYIMGCSIEVQPLRSNKLIPQCKRCQSYGHTQKYCSKEPRCVKCTGKHLTKDCKKPKEEKPKCVHCGAPHPANYRGCAIAKEIQQIRKRNSKNKSQDPQQLQRQQNTQNTTEKATSKTRTSSGMIKNNVSFAQAVSNKTTRPTETSNLETKSDKKLDEILKLMLTFDERLKHVENSTKTALTKLQK